MNRPRALILLAIAAAIAPAVSGQSYATPSGKQKDRVSFLLCAGAPCALGTNLTNHYIVTAAGKVKKCYAQAKTAPIGAPIIFDIRVNGTSIFGAATKLQIPSGSTAVATASTFGNPSVADADLIRIDLVGVGTSATGQDVAVACTIQQN